MTFRDILSYMRDVLLDPGMQQRGTVSSHCLDVQAKAGFLINLKAEVRYLGHLWDSKAVICLTLS